MPTSLALAPGDSSHAQGPEVQQRPIRIVLYVKGFPPRETGGPAEVAFHLVRELLRAANVRLTLIVQSDSTEEEIRDLLGTDEGLQVLRLPYYPTPRELRALRPLLRAFASADVIHFNEFPFRHLPLVALAKARGVPVVFSMHGLLSEEIRTFLGPSYPVTFRQGDGALQVRMPQTLLGVLASVYRSCSSAWTAVIVPSEALRRDAVSKERVPAGRISVIPHGVDLCPGPLKAAFPHDGPLRILYVGKLETVKGPDLFLEALARLPSLESGVDVSIVGAGSLEESLRAHAASRGLHHVAFLGVRRGRDLEALYSKADIVVVPSRSESLSMVALEAMAAGRPLLATNVGGIPEVAKETRNALLVEPDPDALAEGLRRLIEDAGLRASMERANREDSVRRSWANVAARYLDLYRGLIP